MKKNRIIITLLLLAGALSTLGAESIDEIIESAKANSLSYQNIVLNYQSGLLTISEMEKDDEVGVALSATVNPLSDLEPSTLGDTSDKGVTVTPTVSITLPDEGGTTISGGASISTKYKDASTSVSGRIGVSHTFDFTGYSDKHSEDLSYTSTKYSTELTYKKSELSFEQSVLKTISSILTQESSIKQAEFNLEKQQTAFDKLVALKKYSEDSSTYKSTLNTLNSLKSSLSSLEEQYDNLIIRYKTLTGLEWNGVDIGDAPTLTLTTYDNGNTEVLIQSLKAESSEESYKSVLAASKPSRLSTSLDLTATSSEYDISGSLEYSGNNWSVGVSPGVSITSSGKTTPSVTITGSWRNNSNASVASYSSGDNEKGGSGASGYTISGTSEAALKSALNSAKSAANSYLEALSTYEENASSYALQIIEWNNKLSQAEADLEYKKTLLENAEALYELGLYTEEEMKSAELNYSLSQTDYDKVIIDGLVLERDLAIFAL